MVSVGCEVGGMVVVAVVVGGEDVVNAIGEKTLEVVVVGSVVGGTVVTVGMGTPVVVTMGGTSVTGTVVVGTVVVVVVVGSVDVVGISHVVVVSGIVEVVEDVVDGGSPGDCVVVGDSAWVVVVDASGGSDVVTSVVVVGSVCNPL